MKCQLLQHLSGGFCGISSGGFCSISSGPSLFAKVSYLLNFHMMTCLIAQGSLRLEKYLNLEGFLEKSLKIQSALKRT